MTGAPFGMPMGMGMMGMPGMGMMGMGGMGMMNPMYMAGKYTHFLV